MNDQPSDGKIRLFALSSLAKMERAETRAVLEKFRRAPGDTELVLAERYAEVFVGPEQWRSVDVPEGSRYAWDDDAEPNLAGACGLPVGPFRTDGWPRSTEGGPR